MFAGHTNCSVVVCEYLMKTRSCEENKDIECYLIATNQQHLLTYMCVSFKEHTTFVMPYYETKSDVTYHKKMVRYVKNVSTTDMLKEYINAKCIQFSHYFNDPVDHSMFAESVEEVIFGISFNQPLDYNSLPHTVKHLTLGWEYKQHITSLPPLLESLTIMSQTPPTISDGIIPDTVKVITIVQNIIHESCFQVTKLPQKLNSLKIVGGQAIDISKIVFNDEIESLYIKTKLENVLQGYLPKSLKKIAVSDKDVARTIQNQYPHIELIILK